MKPAPTTDKETNVEILSAMKSPCRRVRWALGAVKLGRGLHRVTGQGSQFCYVYLDETVRPFELAADLGKLTGFPARLTPGVMGHAVKCIQRGAVGNGIATENHELAYVGKLLLEDVLRQVAAAGPDDFCSVQVHFCRK